MIIELRKKKINIKPMSVPEPLTKCLIKYAFEYGTNHLTPRLSINNHKFIGNKIFVDLTEALAISNEAIIKVELIDGQGVAIRTYTLDTRGYKYVLLGDRPVRPDFEDYIKELEAKIEELESEGEVI